MLALSEIKGKYIALLSLPYLRGIDLMHIFSKHKVTILSTLLQDGNLCFQTETYICAKGISLHGGRLLRYIMPPLYLAFHNALGLCLNAEILQQPRNKLPIRQRLIHSSHAMTVRKSLSGALIRDKNLRMIYILLLWIHRKMGSKTCFSSDYICR